MASAGLRRVPGWTLWMLASVLLVGCTVFVARATAGQYRLERDLARRGHVADATVLRISSTFGARYPQRELEVRFEDVQGTPYRVTMPAGPEGGEPGAWIRVRYDPADPRRARTAGWRLQNWAAGVVASACCFLVALVLFGIGARARKEARPRDTPRHGTPGDQALEP